MSVCLRTMLLALAVSSAATALAGDAYYNIPLPELKLVDGGLPIEKPQTVWYDWQRMQTMKPYVVLSGPGEGYVGNPNGRGFSTFEMARPVESPAADSGDQPGTGTRVLVRAAAGKEVSGRIVVPNGDSSGMVSLRFTIPASAANPKAKTAFYRAKIAYYEDLLGRNGPGGAWFRRQIRLARAELNLPPGTEVPQGSPGGWRPGMTGELTDTYDLFTGGRAMSENLQFDRVLPPARADETPVKIDSLKGITINEIDWKPLIKDIHPELDPLADKIPADQHVVFFPSFQAALAVADETNQHDTPLLRLAQPRAENARIVERYEAQLGLPLSAVARLLGPKFVKSVALTGSDPFFPMGTDVAVLFEAEQPKVLENLLLGRIALAAAEVKDAKPVGGQVGGLKYQGFVSPDRSMSSYVAGLDGAVVVSNSLYQLGQLAAVAGGKVKSIAGLPEYVFFRNRYRLGDSHETALAFLSDATIRRWCGPRWRIADSRRIRARAVLAELQASQLDALVTKTVKPGYIHTDLPILGGGELTLTPAGVASSTFGTLDFMTPVAETPLEEVSQAEADAYRNWRDGYQRNWSWGFDPIALRISLGKEKLAADMTVMPLILNSEYREFVSLARGGKFGPAAGDTHGALAQVIAAIDRESDTFRQGENALAMMNQAVSLGWMGKWGSVYADDDPFWKDLAELKPTNDFDRGVYKFFEKNLCRLPVAVEVDVSNPLKLAAFLTSARLFIEQTAPGMTHWESLKYKDQPYVRITPAKGGPAPAALGLENIAIYYASVGNVLTVTLSEKLLDRAIDRCLARQKAAAEPKGKPAHEESKPWLGSSVALQVDHKILDVLNAVFRDQYQQAMQVLCWNNLPILNEWKRLYPDRDPVQVHRQVWGVELVCPGGGKYVWNEKYGTMASTVYGHPGEPKDGPPAPPVLSSFASGDFGLTFENHGLRARAVLNREPAKAGK